MRALVLLSVLCIPLAARAQDDATKCADAYSDCHDDCSLKYGLVTRDTERIKLVKCIDKCKRVESECHERIFETKNNGLSEDAVKKEKHDDDLREDNKKKAIIADDPPPKRAAPKEEESKRTRASELDTAPKKAEAEKKEEAPKQAAAEPAKPEEKKKSDSPPASEPKKKKKERALDEWDPEAL